MRSTSSPARSPQTYMVFRGVRFTVRPTTLSIPFCPWGPGWTLANLDSWVVGNSRLRIGPIFPFGVDRAAARTHAADNHRSLATAHACELSAFLACCPLFLGKCVSYRGILQISLPASAFDPPHLSSMRRLVASARLPVKAASGLHVTDAYIIYTFTLCFFLFSYFCAFDGKSNVQC